MEKGTLINPNLIFTKDTKRLIVIIEDENDLENWK